MSDNVSAAYVVLSGDVKCLTHAMSGGTNATTDALACGTKSRLLSRPDGCQRHFHFLANARSPLRLAERLSFQRGQILSLMLRRCLNAKLTLEDGGCWFSFMAK